MYFDRGLEGVPIFINWLESYIYLINYSTLLNSTSALNLGQLSSIISRFNPGVKLIALPLELRAGIGFNATATPQLSAQRARNILFFLVI